KMFKDTGHVNAYFPLFIPVSYLEKEAAHVEGFAKECAVVTHSRLQADGNGKLIPASPLDEPLIVRPTSETIIGEMYAKWVQSYRDLPILVNQWANVVRWEMRTRLFLRTAEFLWQEGHTAHATSEEAWEETRKMLAVYADFAENWMAMPVIQGEKTAGERFPGAVSTLCIEAMMQDKKALQAGTSHFLGQNFAKASGIKFLSDKGVEEHAWTTSWGVSTRLIGGMIMTHGDDNGMVVPPRLAPVHIVILPVTPKEEVRAEVLAYCESLKAELKATVWDGRTLDVQIDDRDIRGGEKAWQWVKKGLPIRIEIGPRDVASNGVFYTRRDTLEKATLPRGEFVAQVGSILDDMQRALLERAKAFRDANIKRIDSKEEFYDFFTAKNADKPEIHGGFAFTHWDGSDEVADKISADLKVTIRCIPLKMPSEEGICPFSGRPSKQRVIWAKSY
ncbi:MAG: proline--tRNA ligase, partial [Opitutales bacterium]|nr:proline--tRNA ligase [Opitutales bacterium]